MADVVVIGGGLAGLSTAVELASRGLEVTVLEQASQVGGKLGAFRDADGDTVEHGMHGFWTQYYNLFELMRKVGVPDEALVGPIDTSWVRADGTLVTPRFPSPPRPTPLHLLTQVAGASLGFWDVVAGMRAFGPAFGFEHRRDYAHWDEHSLYGLLADRGATRDLLEVTIEPLARSFGFTSSRDLSAAAFLSALSFYLVGHQDDIRMRVLDGNPAELVLEPLSRFITDHGGTVRTSAPAHRLEVDDAGRIRAVRLAGDGAAEARFAVDEVPLGTPVRKELPDGRALLLQRSADEVVALSAVCTHAGGPVGYRDGEGDLHCPWHGATFDLDGRVTGGPAPTRLPRLDARVEGDEVVVTLDEGDGEAIEAGDVVLATEVAGAQRLLRKSPELLRHPDLEDVLNLAGTASIVVRLWLDREPPGIVSGVFSSPDLIDAFFVPSRWQDELSGRAVVEAHAYVVRDRMHLSDEQLVERVMDEIRERFPEMRDAGVHKSHVSRHPESFTWFRPGSHRHMPSTATGCDNLWMAGDWIRTDEPWWYMERAVATGRLAANAILERRSLEPVPVREPRPDQPFTRVAKFTTGAARKISRGLGKLVGYRPLG